MADVMVTGRMSERKKADAGRILQREGISASQAINMMYDRVIADQSAEFLTVSKDVDAMTWAAAAAFIDSIPKPRKTRFDTMSKEQIRKERLKARGLI